MSVDSSADWPTLTELFESSASQHLDRPCFAASEPVSLSWTYREVSRRMLRLARRLIEAGLRPDQAVALTGANSPEWAVAYLAILKAGAVVVPLDPQLKPEETVLLAKAGDCVGFIADSGRYSALAGAFPQAAVSWGLDEGQPGTAGGPLREDKEEFPLRRPADLAAILFTSGTTGQPKGVMLSHENLTSDCLLAQRLMPLFETDIFYALLPLHHSYTMLAVFLEALSVGASVFFARKMAASQVLRDLREGGVTMFLGVPLLFNKLMLGILDGVRKKGPVVNGLVRGLMAFSGFVKLTTRSNPGRRLFRPLLEQAGLGHVRICISGGGPLAPSVFKKFNQLGVDFVQGYGLTETSPILALNPVEAYRVHSVGKILPGVEIRLEGTDETGQGEIVVRGPMVMQGYYRNPEATSKVLLPDGWLKTGDIGRLDAKGYLQITGRSKSLIVTEGGKNVYPEEIEFAFQLHPEVEQVFVKGFILHTEHRTEGIEAWIYPAETHLRQPEPERREHFQHVVNQVNAGLRPYQRIARFHVLDKPLEMTSTRKVRRVGQTIA